MQNSNWLHSNIPGLVLHIERPTDALSAAISCAEWSSGEGEVETHASVQNSRCLRTFASRRGSFRPFTQKRVRCGAGASHRRMCVGHFDQLFGRRNAPPGRIPAGL